MRSRFNHLDADERALLSTGLMLAMDVWKDDARTCGEVGLKDTFLGYVKTAERLREEIEG